MSLPALIEKLIEFLRNKISILEKENRALKSENAILKDKENVIESQLKKVEEEIERLHQVIKRLKKDDTETHLDAITEKVLKRFYDMGRKLSVEEVAPALSMDLSTTQYHFDVLSKAELILQTTLADKSSLTGESTPALFELSYSGRKYLTENKIVT